MAKQSETELREAAELARAIKQLEEREAAENAWREREAAQCVQQGDRTFKVKLSIDNVLVGNEVKRIGDIVSVGEQLARRMCLDGSATAASPGALFSLPSAQKKPAVTPQSNAEAYRASLPQPDRPNLTKWAPDRTREVEVITSERRCYYHRSGQSFGRGARLFLDEIEAIKGVGLGIFAAVDPESPERAKPAAKNQAIAQPA